MIMNKKPTSSLTFTFICAALTLSALLIIGAPNNQVRADEPIAPTTSVAPDELKLNDENNNNNDDKDPIATPPAPQPTPIANQQQVVTPAAGINEQQPQQQQQQQLNVKPDTITITDQHQQQQKQQHQQQQQQVIPFNQQQQQEKGNSHLSSDLSQINLINDDDFDRFIPQYQPAFSPFSFFNTNNNNLNQHTSQFQYRDPISQLMEQMRQSRQNFERRMDQMRSSVEANGGEGQSNSYYSSNGVAYVKTCTIKRV